MKRLILNLIGIFLFFSLYSQELNSSFSDSLLKRAVEKSAVDLISNDFDYYWRADSTEVVYIEVKKQGDSLQVTILYSSFKDYRFAIGNAINAKPIWKYTKPIPDGYECIVPIYFSVESTTTGNFSFPTTAQERAVRKALQTRLDRVSILPPVKVFIYQPVRKAAYNIRL